MVLMVVLVVARAALMVQRLEQVVAVQQGKDLPMELLALEAAQPILLVQAVEEQVVLLPADPQQAQMAIILVDLVCFQTS
jgi:hypothetical protein